jgi:hypothetical protein
MNIKRVVVVIFLLIGGIAMNVNAANKVIEEKYLVAYDIVSRGNGFQMTDDSGKSIGFARGFEFLKGYPNVRFVGKISILKNKEIVCDFLDDKEAVIFQMIEGQLIIESITNS